MKKAGSWCLVSSLLLFMNCGKSTNPDKTGQLVTIKVVDAVGAPAAGLRVGSINHFELPVVPEKSSMMPKACPATDITFSLPKAGHYTLSILDYFGEEVRLFDGDREAGSLVIAWNGHDENGDPVVSGFYRYLLTVVYDEGGLFNDEKWMVLELGADPSSTIIGTTDSNGVYATEDTLLFPCLLGAPPPIVRRSEFGQIIDTVYDFYEDVVTLTLSSSDAPDKFMYFERPLIVGSNYFTLVWDPSQAY